MTDPTRDVIKFECEKCKRQVERPESNYREPVCYACRQAAREQEYFQRLAR